VRTGFHRFFYLEIYVTFKLFLCSIKYRATSGNKGEEVYLHGFLTSSLDAESKYSHSDRLLAGWARREAGLNVLVKIIAVIFP
jgi:hypothetical protein